MRAMISQYEFIKMHLRHGREISELQYTQPPNADILWPGSSRNLSSSNNPR